MAEFKQVSAPTKETPAPTPKVDRTAQRLETPDPAVFAKLENGRMNVPILNHESKEIKSQVEDFFGEDPEEEEEPEEEPTPKPAAKVEEPEEEPEEEEEEEEDDETELDEDEEAEESDEEEKDAEQPEDNLDDLRSWMNEEAQKALSRNTPAAPTPEPEKVFEVSEDDYSEALQDPKKFTEILNRAVQFGVEKSQKQQQVIAAHQQSIKDTVDNFYKDNPDLVQYDPMVSLVSQNVAADHSDWDLVQILTETEKIVRTKLKLKRVPTNGKKVDGKKVVEPKKPKVRKPHAKRQSVQPQLSEQEKHMVALL